MQKKSDALGKGIRSLLQNIDAELKNTSGSLKNEVIEKSTGTMNVSLDKIDVNPHQPRTDFNETALKELSDSIKLHGIIQPLTVSTIPNGRYRLIAGERRFRASKMAGLKEVPVYIRDLNKDSILELALLENLQRENLNAIEIAISYKRLMDELSYTEEQLADRIGKDRSTVANDIRLLKLPPAIQIAVRSKEISKAHARSIISIEMADKQMFIFNEIKNKKLSVRQTEELVRKMQAGKSAKESSKQSPIPDTYKKIENNIASQFGTRVKLTHNKKGYGSILFEYYSIDELNALLEKLKINVS